MSKWCWKNGANKFAQCRVATNLHFVRKRNYLRSAIKWSTIKWGIPVIVPWFLSVKVLPTWLTLFSSPMIFTGITKLGPGLQRRRTELSNIGALLTWWLWWMRMSSGPLKMDPIWHILLSAPFDCFAFCQGSSGIFISLSACYHFFPRFLKVSLEASLPHSLGSWPRC